MRSSREYVIIITDFCYTSMRNRFTRRNLVVKTDEIRFVVVVVIYLIN